ncbi:Dual specificity protein phosphatase 10 [Mortierella claussenii]|nr:Dual specificity protein phosphatase 10 [Mortierella claussenii]
MSSYMINEPSTPISSTFTSSPPSSLSPPIPMMRPVSHSFSLQRPTPPPQQLQQDSKKIRNSKRLSLLVPPSPGKLETMASMAAAAVPSTPSFLPSTSSFSGRRHFSSAPLSTIPSQSPAVTPTKAEADESCHDIESSSRRHSQLMLDQALPQTPRLLPLSANHSYSNSQYTQQQQLPARPLKQRPISAYFADFSAECGTASPYTKEPVCVLPHLFLGAEHNAMDVSVLTRLGITAVLNVAIEISSAAASEQTTSNLTTTPTTTTTMLDNTDRIIKTSQGHAIHYKNLSWTHHQRNLQSEFPMAFAFIEETQRMGGKVLIHCQLGVSRSASLVIAYVMKTRRMNLTDAYDFVKGKSSVISPNMSLMYQLAEFGKSIEQPTMNNRSNNNNRSQWAAAREDEDDYYPYPTDRIDVDVDMGMAMDRVEVQKKDVVEKEEKKKPSLVLKAATSTTTASTASSSKRSSLALAPVITTRPRAPYHRTSPPLPLASLTASMGVAAPKTPMTDRFTFPSEPPSTPMSDCFSIPEIPSTPLRSQFQFPEGESSFGEILSPPKRPFVRSCHKPTDSVSSMSSFASSASFSRPSSTSSTASVTMSVTTTTTMMMKGPDAPTTTPVVSEGPARSIKTTKTATIHHLAKALTRRWSNGFPGCQQQLESVPPSSMHPSASFDVMMQVDLKENDGEQEEKQDAKKDEKEDQEKDVIFSPRPYSPPLLETKTFGEFYQALRMEG